MAEWHFATLLKEQKMATIIETSTSKSDRINCRIRPLIKARAEAGAQALGQSITAFTETALAEKAHSVLAEQERMVVASPRGQAQSFDLFFIRPLA